MIIVSYLFNYGETFHVFRYYKRSFSVFGDGINIILIFFYFIFLLNKNYIFTLLCVIAFLMSFGKMAFILMFICFFILWYFDKEERLYLLKSFIFSLFVSVLFYFSFAEISHRVTGSNDLSASTVNREKIISNPLNMKQEAYKGEMYRDCDYCVITTPLRRRVLSWSAGLWMTMHGGFANDEYDFAELMWKVNPYNVNKILNVTYQEWDDIQVVSNAFLGIGGSYGPAAMLLFIIFTFSIIYFGWKFRFSAESNLYSVCLAYFITIIIFNQTQQYVQAYSDDLIVLSFCGMYLLKSMYNQNPICK
jgi:hypothetical protein